MALWRDVQPYRRLFVAMVRLYPRLHRERFGEGMAQTFDDLMRERVAQRRSRLLLVVEVYVETGRAVIQAHWKNTMHDIRYRRPAAITALILSIPLVMSIIDRHKPAGDGWHWGPEDFLAMGALLFGAGMVYEFLAGKVTGGARRAAIGGVVVTCVLAVWVELAVDGVSKLIGAL